MHCVNVAEGGDEASAEPIRRASAAAHQRNDGGTEEDLHEHVLKLLDNQGKDGLACLWGETKGV